MAEIVNLKRHRKAKARSDKEAAADANRRLFGRTRAEKDRDAADKAAETRALDAHRLEDPPRQT